jgi:protein tyrosine phosphatase
MSTLTSIGVSGYTPPSSFSSQIVEPISSVYAHDVSQRFAKADQGFLQVWTRFGKPDAEFPQWSPHARCAEIISRFNLLEPARRDVYRNLKANDVLFFSSEKEQYENTPPFAYNRASDVYNASLIHIHGLRFIAMEAPQERTLEKFFHILEAYNVSALVRLATFVTHYWNPDENVLRLPGGKQISYISTDTWADGMGLPSQELHSLVREARSANESEQSITAVHCQAGMGRAGTFIAAYVIAHEIDDAVDHNRAVHFSIDKLVWELSLQRRLTVSSFSQFLTLYKFADYYLDFKQHESPVK